MSDDRKSSSAAAGARGYKRSWKNLLINKRYQLRFTLFMVLVSTLLMVGLGWWVMAVADEATHVKQNSAIGNGCVAPDLYAKKVDRAAAARTPAPLPAPAAAADDEKPAAAPENEAPAPAAAGDEAAPTAPPPAGAAADDADDDGAPAGDEPAPGERRVEVVTEDIEVTENVEVDDLRTADGVLLDVAIATIRYTTPDATDVADVHAKIARQVTEHVNGSKHAGLAGGDGAAFRARIDEVATATGITVTDARFMVVTRALNPTYANAIAKYHECGLRQQAKLDELEAGRRRIFFVLLASGLLLVLGLAFYGIKMTHKVAGPLYKITLYMGKMRDGKFDKVYNLRKGDQLVDFYEHFKQAHAGVVAMEQEDIDRLRALLAEAEGLAGKSPEVDAALAELQTILARKEKSLE